jgi:hypothetical protein
MVQILMLVPLLFVGLGLLALIAAALRPPVFKVQRKIRIAVPPERVYPLIADFKRWRSWSPWEGLDPDLKRTYGGADSGKGATYAWEGNKKAGAGSMVITEAAAPYAVGIDLQFTRPFPAHNSTEFMLKPDARSTEVTWAMSGAQGVMMRLMTMFFSMEKMIGPDFERGLAQLKTEAEKTA